MGQISISITKRCAYRDSVQHFSNVYTYRSADSNPVFDTAGLLIDEVANIEKKFHSLDVTFVKGRCWSSGGTRAENKMIAERVLSGAGIQQPVPQLDRERALLVMWRAGKDTRGKPVYLRKWYHTLGNLAGVVFSASILEQKTGFTAQQRADMAAAITQITRIGALQEWGLTAESGRERDGGEPIVHKYLEHHQLGDEWRG